MDPERDPVSALDDALGRHAADWRNLVVAFSGGPDSTALLAAATRVAPKRRVRAVHVDHGWHPESGNWARQCREVARGLGVYCEVVAAEIDHDAGEGPEAAARRARHARLSERVGRGDVLLTAHHRDDQAETLLLALFRGGGVHGWAGMPTVRTFGGGGLHLRPWLELAREELRDWLRAQGLSAIDDPANTDSRYERAWLRQSVLPILRERLPGIDVTLARAAGLACEAAGGVDAMAAHDYGRCRGHVDQTLDCAALETLPASRRRGLLRWWIARAGLPRPPANRVRELDDQLRRARPDRNPRITWPGGEVRRWRGMAWALPPFVAVDAARDYPWTDLHRPLALPHRTLDPSVLERLGLDVVPDARVTIRFRRGGERFRLPGAARDRALKTLLADRGVPPWERDRVPLVYVDDELVAVVGLGRAADPH
jgi:tRNA(Ile)-lysidine synthase